MVKVADSILRVFYNSKNNNDDNDNTRWITALEFLSFLPPKVCFLIVPISPRYDTMLGRL